MNETDLNYNQFRSVEFTSYFAEMKSASIDSIAEFARKYNVVLKRRSRTVLERCVLMRLRDDRKVRTYP